MLFQRHVKLYHCTVIFCVQKDMRVLFLTSCILAYSPCHDYVDVQPFYTTCVSHLSQIQERKGRPGPAARKRGMASRRMPRRVLPRRPPGAAEEPSRVSRMPEHRAPRPKIINNLFFLYNQDYAEASGEEMEASCNVLAAYSSVCSRNDVKLLPPRPCGESPSSRSFGN